MGVLLAFLGCFGVGFGGGKVGGRERQRQPNKRERAHGAHGNRKRRKRERAHGLPVLGGFSSVRKSYLFNVDNICRMVGGILQPNGNRKTANSMCPLTITPTNFSPNTEHIRSVGGFGNLPNSGGEFRNRNHGVFL